MGQGQRGQGWSKTHEGDRNICHQKTENDLLEKTRRESERVNTRMHNMHRMLSEGEDMSAMPQSCKGG